MILHYELNGQMYQEKILDFKRISTHTTDEIWMQNGAKYFKLYPLTNKCTMYIYGQPSQEVIVGDFIC